MALKLSSRNLFRSADILQNQSQKNKKSVSNIGKTLQRQSVFKRQSIAKRKNLYAQKATAIRRKNQQDFLDASRSTGSRRSVGQIVRGSNKGFFGRILEAVSFAMVGWAVQNLPRIVTMANKLGQQIPKLTTILSSFMNNTFSIFKEIGSLSGGLVRSLFAFDFSSMGRQVQTSLVNLSIQFGRLEEDLYEGMKVFAEVFKFEPEKPGPGQQPPGQQPPSQEPPLSGKRGDYGPPGEGAAKRYAASKGYSAEFTAGLLATISQESSFNPYAKGDSGSSYGLFQFNNRAGRRQPFLNYLAANGIPNPMALWQNPNGPSAKKYRNQVFGLTLEYMMEKEDGAQLVRDYRNSSDLRTIMGGFEDIEGYAGSQSGPRNQRNNGEYRERLAEAQAYLKQLKSSPSTQTRPSSTNFTAVTGTSGSVSINGRTQAPLSVPYSPFKPGSRMVITSGIGYRSSTNSNHSGYDIAGPEGTPIYAYFPGKIINVGVWNGSFSGYGNYVVWQDDIYGAYHFFGHMRDRPGWSPGQKFSQGTLIGYVGNTGRSTGPHLHWEISENRPDSIGNFSSLEDPGSWLRKHPLVFSSTSQRTPAQISSTRVTQNIPENITPANEGETIYVTVPQQAYQNAGVSAGAGGGGSIIIGGGDSLNSLIKQRILLELAYT